MDKARLLLVMHSHGTRSGGLKLERWKFHTNMWKNFFIGGMTECWNRFPREVVESPPLELFKTYLDTYLCPTVGNLL